MSADVELLRRATDVFNRGELDALREFYTPDISADAGELWPAAGRINGVEQVLAEFASIFSVFERVEVIAERYIERGGGVVVVPSRWCGTIAGSSNVIEQALVAVYRVRDGRVASIEYLQDLDAALAASAQAQAQAQPKTGEPAPGDLGDPARGG
jgi:uncharacterized protein